MKKFLVVLLALAMVFAIATTAMAADKQIPDYNDTKTSTEYAVDIYRLTALGVLEGNTGWGGAYRPNDNLTRAEFAKIACFMFGKQDYKEYYAAQQSAFSDVPEGHWAEGWINCANDNGLMIGIGGGKFAPEANVTKQEVATVTLRGVGYDDNLPGEWPADYIAKSQEVHTWLEETYKNGESLFDYVEKIDGTAASRAEMAAIVNYCLELFRVEYVGDQTMIAGISSYLGVDKDGYMYLNAPDTNELTTTSWLNGPMSQGTTLLWDVFKAWTEPEYLFASWDYELPLLAEAAGWGYEDFDEYGFDELVFSGNGVYTPDFVRPTPSLMKDGYEEDVEETAVATNYYIFDQYLDGELWQLSNRYAMLTVQYNKKAYNKCEALFAEMMTDVKYDSEANEDVYTDADVYETDEFAYSYDNFAHLDFAIVNDVKKGDIATVDAEFGYGEDFGNEFCLLDECDTHDKNYVFLKDGKFYEDASCLEVNDVVYNAGELNTTNPDGWVCLYIVISPEKATLKEVVYSPDDEADEPDGTCPEGDLRQVNIDGVDYWFCEEAAEPTKAAIEPSEAEEEEPAYDGPHCMSLDGGYTAGSYEAMIYGDDGENVGLYDKLTDGDKDIRFAPAYAKKYAATIIFGASSENKKYGVITDFDFLHIYPEPDDYYAKKVDFFGPDGKQTGLIGLDESINVGSGDEATGEDLLGTLTNYFLTGDDLVITDEEEAFNWIKYTPGKNDIGFIALDPDNWGEEPIEIQTKAGKFTTDAADAIDDAALLLDAEKMGVDAAGDLESAAGKKITANTVIFEIKTNKDGEFKSVKLGDNAKYMDAEFTADQFNIFAWADKDVTALYVVNPSFAADEQIGLFDINRADEDGGFVKYMEDGTKVYFNKNAAKDYLPDTRYVYAAYKVKDGKLDQVIGEGETYGPEITAGDFVVLVTKDGYFIDEESAKAIIKAKVDGAEDVSPVLSADDAEAYLADPYEVADDCVFIDLVNGEEYRIGEVGKVIHDKTSDYAYIFVCDDTFDIIQVIRVDAGAVAGE